MRHLIRCWLAGRAGGSVFTEPQHSEMVLQRLKHPQQGEPSFLVVGTSSYINWDNHHLTYNGHGIIDCPHDPFGINPESSVSGFHPRPCCTTLEGSTFTKDECLFFGIQGTNTLPDEYIRPKRVQVFKSSSRQGPRTIAQRTKIKAVVGPFPFHSFTFTSDLPLNQWLLSMQLVSSPGDRQPRSPIATTRRPIPAAQLGESIKGRGTGQISAVQTWSDPSTAHATVDTPPPVQLPRLLDLLGESKCGERLGRVLALGNLDEPRTMHGL